MMRVSSLAKHWDGLEVQRHGYSHAGLCCPSISKIGAYVRWECVPCYRLGE